MDLPTGRFRSLTSSPGLILGWFIAIAVAVLAYWPGLGGPFVFDDFGSIGALGQTGGVTEIKEETE